MKVAHNDVLSITPSPIYILSFIRTVRASASRWRHVSVRGDYQNRRFNLRIKSSIQASNAAYSTDSTSLSDASSASNRAKWWMRRPETYTSRCSLTRTALPCIWKQGWHCGHNACFTYESVSQWVCTFIYMDTLTRTLILNHFLQNDSFISFAILVGGIWSAMKRSVVSSCLLPQWWHPSKRPFLFTAIRSLSVATGDEEGTAPLSEYGRFWPSTVVQQLRKDENSGAGIFVHHVRACVFMWI